MSIIINEIKQAIIRRIASSHLAGPEFIDAERIYHRALKRKWLCAFGPWTDPSHTVEETAQSYRNDLHQIINESLDCYFSIKLTTIKYDLPIVKELLGEASRKGIRVHFDAMDPDSAAPTYKLIEQVVGMYQNIGCTLPSRWHRSIKDVERVVEFGIPVRIIKGQWSDPVGPGPHPRDNFLAITDSLSGRAKLVAIATHDRKLAHQALKRLIGTGTSCEMEQLSILPQNCAHLAKTLNVPMRIYIPYGFPSLPYNILNVKARPMIVGWALRDFLLGGHKHLTHVH